MLHFEDLHWKQHSCTKWALDGDRNTRFYQLYNMNRKKEYAIAWVKLVDGTFTEDHMKITNCFISNFSDIFSN